VLRLVRSAQRPGQGRWNRDWVPGTLRAALPALLLFVVARAVGFVVVLMLSRHSVGYTVHRLAVHWDAAWYLDIARHGYDHAIRAALPGAHHRRYTNLAFFPVYPALIWLLHTLLPLLPWGVAGLITAGLCSLVAAWGIHAAVADRYGQRVATMAALLWGVAPTAVVETAGYSESAFTALAAWALFAVVRRRWIAAGVLAVLAGLTRPTGVAVAAAVMAAAALEVWEQLRARHAGSERFAWLARVDRLIAFGRGADGDAGVGAAAPPRRAPRWQPLVAAVLAPVGWVGFVAWTALRLHSWNAYFQIQALWKTRFDFGHTTGADFKMLFTRSTPVNLYVPVVGCVLIAAVVLLVATVAQRQPLPFVVLSMIMVVIALGDAAYFSSRARFLLPAFPLLLPIASGLARLRNRAVLVAVLASAAGVSALYGAYVILYAPSPP
jgi:hypothetical protein